MTQDIYQRNSVVSDDHIDFKVTSKPSVRPNKRFNILYHSTQYLYEKK
jgi:hypothetical protein